MNATHSPHGVQSFSAWESGFVSPAYASTLSGLSPFRLRALVFPDRGGGPSIRSVHRQGRLFVHIGDVLLVAGALAEGRPAP
jgi:hypothetical protein